VYAYLSNNHLQSISDLPVTDLLGFSSRSNGALLYSHRSILRMCRGRKSPIQNTAAFVSVPICTRPVECHRRMHDWHA